MESPSTVCSSFGRCVSVNGMMRTSSPYSVRSTTCVGVCTMCRMFVEPMKVIGGSPRLVMHRSQFGRSSILSYSDGPPVIVSLRASAV